MRYIETHKVSDFNHDRVQVVAEPPPQFPVVRKAPVKYHVWLKGAGDVWAGALDIKFQDGPLVTTSLANQPINHPPNGITNEALLAVILDRLEYLDQEEPCRENMKAIGHVKKAMAEMAKRAGARGQQKFLEKDKTP